MEVRVHGLPRLPGLTCAESSKHSSIYYRQCALIHYMQQAGYGAVHSVLLS